MIEYIKILIVSLVCGASLPLPVSSASHYSFLNSFINISDDSKTLGLYYSVIALTFSAVIFVLLRKIYSSSIRSLFDKDRKLTNYRKLMKNLALSLIPMIVLFIPMGEGKLLCDVFDEFLVKSNVLLVAFASIICGLILVISMWYTKESYAVTKRGADIKTVIRSSVYQLVSYVIPGFSHISSATTNMLICDVESKVVIREIYLYIAPQMFIVNLVKLIRYILGDTVINPIMIIISVIAAAVMSYIVVTKMSKINIRRILPFFAVYCIASGIIFCVLSLVL